MISGAHSGAKKKAAYPAGIAAGAGCIGIADSPRTKNSPISFGYGEFIVNFSFPQLRMISLQ